MTSPLVGRLSGINVSACLDFTTKDTKGTKHAIQKSYNCLRASSRSSRWMQEPNVSVYKFYHEVHEGHEVKTKNIEFLSS